MIVAVGPDGSVGLDEADDLARFHVSAPSADLARSALVGAGAGRVEADGDAWILVAWLRAAVGERSGDADWSDGFARMLDYARAHGWLDPDGDAVRAHVETA